MEIAAAAFGVISVFLSARQNIWSWPTAIINVTAYAAIFFNGRLYGQMALQAVYLALSIYGWHQWRFGGEHHSLLVVSRATPRTMTALAVGVGVATVVLAAILRRTDAALPWLDALLTATSLAAQWMMTRKILETWVLWIAVDIIYVPMFISQGLFATAGLYAAFLLIAVMGLRDWRRAFDERRAVSG